MQTFIEEQYEMRNQKGSEAAEAPSAYLGSNFSFLMSSSASVLRRRNGIKTPFVPGAAADNAGEGEP
jgi:hypothetical protein